MPIPRKPRKKRELAPLIPLDDLKTFVRAIIAVPKDEIDRAEAERPKRTRTQKQPK